MFRKFWRSSPLRQLEAKLENPLFLSKYLPFLYWKVYDLSWISFYPIFESQISRYSPWASCAGYFVFLSDALVKHLGFKFITDGASSAFGLSIEDKLILIYIGSISLTIRRIIYLTGRPGPIKYGPDQAAWVKFGLENFTFGDFQGMHHDIRENGHRTIYGKYYDDDWDAFKTDAIWDQSGKSPNSRANGNRERFSFTAAKLKHEDVLRSILIDRYHQYCAKYKIRLVMGLIFTLPGLAMFLTPSIDLFITLVKNTLLQ